MAAGFHPSDTTDTVITDVTVTFARESPSSLDGPRRWQRIEKDLYLHRGPRTAWLQLAQTDRPSVAAATDDDLVVSDLQVADSSPGDAWERRPAGIWILRTSSTSKEEALTQIDILFGSDAVDPRSFWTLLPKSLQLDGQPEDDDQKAKLSLQRRHVSTPKDPAPNNGKKLRTREDGTFKIVQISDTHMRTSPGCCEDASDADGNPLPPFEADPATINLISDILDEETPDLVVFTGDQVHHDIPDTQSALLKLVAPVIQRSIPFALVFGNHDDEGDYALSREAQMALLQDLPSSLCQAGPSDVDGVGNYYLQIFPTEPSQDYPLATLYFLDSHGEVPSRDGAREHDYDFIKQTQINWFKDTSKRLRRGQEKQQKQQQDEEQNQNDSLHHMLSLAFWHIPTPEFGYDSSRLVTRGGRRVEPTEGSSINSHFYDALVEDGSIMAVGCGHDHVNDFCGLLKDDTDTPPHGPWLCQGGGTGFGGYGSYGKERYHRRSRVWELDMRGSGAWLKTWKRVEYAKDRVDELVLVENGAIVVPRKGKSLEV